MAATRALLDSSPLVAYLNRNDRHHRWAVKCWRALVDPLWTCEAVVSEAIFLVQSDGADADAILRLVERQLVCLDCTLDDHRADVCRLLRKYADRPMSLAVACLVRRADHASQNPLSRRRASCGGMSPRHRRSTHARSRVAMLSSVVLVAPRDSSPENRYLPSPLPRMSPVVSCFQTVKATASAYRRNSRLNLITTARLRSAVVSGLASVSKSSV